MVLIDRRTLLAAAVAVAASVSAAAAADKTEIDAGVAAALVDLSETVPGAADLLAQAKGVLVMPRVVKGGFVVGGSYGEGALQVAGETVEYYSVAAASVGFQAGIQSSKQAVIFMTEAALAQFRAADGWEVGADAEVTILERGVSAGLDTTTRAAPVIGVVWGEEGLMAGASIEGAKYTRIVR